MFRMIEYFHNLEVMQHTCLKTKINKFDNIRVKNLFIARHQRVKKISHTPGEDICNTHNQQRINIQNI